jgi:hypothetical protein
VIDTVPPDGATDVPTSWSGSAGVGFAPLIARYGIAALHDGEPVMLRENGGPARELAASYNTQLRTLSATPPESFTAGAEYEIQWPGLGSIVTPGTRGEGAVVRFRVGFEPDREAPDFEGLTSVDWDFERKYDRCSDNESERYLFDVGVPPPSDDGGAELLTLIVFQTSGPTQGPTPTEVHVQGYDGSPRARVSRPVSASVGRICFSALVRDPSGNISAGSASREVCTKTVRPPFFEGCSVGRRPASGSHALTLLLVVGLAFRVRGRRSGRSRRMN